MCVDILRTIGICTAYILLRLFMPRFFNLTRSISIDARAFGSVLIITTTCIIGYALGVYLPDPWWADRARHVVGGGLAVTLACFCALREGAPRLGVPRFAALATCTVSILGLINECGEFLLGITDPRYTFDRYDTEWDLISNTVGLIVGICVLAPFARKDPVRSW
ncbi:hypothetical protein FJY93_01295 [Candidatus Kaiserbacteria bacterium]|nr:hypothetical protein [Candidatus Kaiserbacteria bacterium]